MKTITLTPETLKPLKPKQQLNYTRSRIRNNNIRNVQLESINKLSDIVSNRKFRESGHIFYLKFNEKERSKTIPTKPVHRVDLEKCRENNQSWVGSECLKEVYNPQEQMLSSSLIDDARFYRRSLDNIQPRTQKQQKIKSLQPIDKQGNNKTLYFYKKESLNAELEFFKFYNKYEKPKIDNQIDFNSELIGTQKTFYHKIKPISLTKRSISVNTKEKIKDGTQNCGKIKQLSEIKQSRDKIKIKLEPLHLGQARKIIDNKKREYFQPWSYGVQDHQTYRI